MGIFRKIDKTVMPVTGYAVPNQVSGLFTPSTLAQAVFHDVDSSAFPVSIEEALAVPAVFRGLQLFSSTCSRFPLTGVQLTPSAGAITPQLRIATTIQDLILVGAAVWIVTRDENGLVNSGERVHPTRWAVNAEGHIVIDGQIAPDNDVLYFASLLPQGLLEAARASIRQYTSISATISNRSAVPQPAIIVGPDTEIGVEDADEIQDMIERLSDTLENRRGGIVYKPFGLQIEAFGGSDSANQMMIEARNALRTDIANFLGVSAAMLDGTQSGAGDIYTNALQSKSEFLEFSVKTWTEPIADRLSQPDACGTTVAFDYSQFDAITDAAGNLGSPRESNELRNTI